MSQSGNDGGSGGAQWGGGVPPGPSDDEWAGAFPPPQSGGAPEYGDAGAGQFAGYPPIEPDQTGWSAPSEPPNPWAASGAGEPPNPWGGQAAGGGGAGYGQGMQVGQVLNGYRWNGFSWEPAMAQHPAEYPVGTVIDGQRWNGYTWEPVGAAGSSAKQWYRQWWVIALAVVVVVAIIGGLLLLMSGGEEEPIVVPSHTASPRATASASASASASPSSSRSFATGSSSASAPVTGVVGAPVRDVNLEFTVTRTKAGVATLGTAPTTFTPKGSFTLVELQVKNTGSQAQKFDPSTITGSDNLGRTLTPDATTTLWANNGTLPFTNALTPGGSAKTVLVFDVPQGSQLTVLNVRESATSQGVQISLT